jgi:hypothetical protein
MCIWAADGKQIFKCRIFFKFKFKFSKGCVANNIGAACNSRIPSANLNAGLKFVHAKEFQPLK